MDSDHVIKTSTDIALGVVAIASPVWLQFLQTFTGLFTAIGGMLLIALRLAIAWHEWRGRK